LRWSRDEKLWQWFLELFIRARDFSDTVAYQRLKDQIIAVEKNHNTHGNRFHYLAVAPNSFRPSCKSWANRPHAGEKEHGSVIVEKPLAMIWNPQFS